MHKLIEELQGRSGVLSAGAVDGTPLSGNNGSLPVRIEGRPATARGADRPAATVFSVSADYLSTMGIHLQRGRYLNKHDAQNPVAIINATAAETFWPHRNALGKRIALDDGTAKPQDLSVVGVVSDTRDVNIDQPARSALYLPMERGVAPPQMVVVRMRDDLPDTAAGQVIRSSVVTLDKNQPVFLVTSMDDLYNNSIAERRFTTFLLTGLGALALALAALGVYGVVSYSTTQRTKEMGIRAALGAQRGQIMWLVLSRGLSLSIIGIVLGGGTGLLLTRYLSSLLYEVTPDDVPTMTTVMLLIISVSAMAGLLPSYRAARIDPMQALRHD